MAIAVNDEDAQHCLVEEAKNLIQDICDEHLSAIEAVIKDPVLKKSLSEEIKQECHELAEYAVAAKRFKLEVNSRAKDRVVSFGEKLSARFMTYMLRERVRRIPHGWSRSEQGKNG